MNNIVCSKNEYNENATSTENPTHKLQVDDINIKNLPIEDYTSYSNNSSNTLHEPLNWNGSKKKEYSKYLNTMGNSIIGNTELERSNIIHPNAIMDSKSESKNLKDFLSSSIESMSIPENIIFVKKTEINAVNTLHQIHMEPEEDNCLKSGLTGELMSSDLLKKMEICDPSDSDHRKEEETENDRKNNEPLELQIEEIEYGSNHFINTVQNNLVNSIHKSFTEENPKNSCIKDHFLMNTTESKKETENRVVLYEPISVIEYTQSTEKKEIEEIKEAPIRETVKRPIIIKEESPIHVVDAEQPIHKERNEKENTDNKNHTRRTTNEVSHLYRTSEIEKDFEQYVKPHMNNDSYENPKEEPNYTKEINAQPLQDLQNKIDSHGNQFLDQKVHETIATKEIEKPMLTQTEKEPTWNTHSLNENNSMHYRKEQERKNHAYNKNLRLFNEVLKYKAELIDSTNKESPMKIIHCKETCKEEKQLNIEHIVNPIWKEGTRICKSQTRELNMEPSTNGKKNTQLWNEERNYSNFFKEESSNHDSTNNGSIKINKEFEPNNLQKNPFLSREPISQNKEAIHDFVSFSKKSQRQHSPFHSESLRKIQDSNNTNQVVWNNKPNNTASFIFQNKEEVESKRKGSSENHWLKDVSEEKPSRRVSYFSNFVNSQKTDSNINMRNEENEMKHTNAQITFAQSNMEHPKVKIHNKEISYQNSIFRNREKNSSNHTQFSYENHKEYKNQPKPNENTRYQEERIHRRNVLEPNVTAPNHGSYVEYDLNQNSQELNQQEYSILDDIRADLSDNNEDDYTPMNLYTSSNFHIKKEDATHYSSRESSNIINYSNAPNNILPAHQKFNLEENEETQEYETEKKNPWNHETNNCDTMEIMQELKRVEDNIKNLEKNQSNLIRIEINEEEKKRKENFAEKKTSIQMPMSINTMPSANPNGINIKMSVNIHVKEIYFVKYKYIKCVVMNNCGLIVHSFILQKNLLESNNEESILFKIYEKNKSQNNILQPDDIQVLMEELNRILSSNISFQLVFDAISVNGKINIATSSFFRLSFYGIDEICMEEHEHIKQDNKIFLPQSLKEGEVYEKQKQEEEAEKETFEELQPEKKEERRDHEIEGEQESRKKIEPSKNVNKIIQNHKKQILVKTQKSININKNNGNIKEKKKENSPKKENIGWNKKKTTTQVSSMNVHVEQKKNKNQKNHSNTNIIKRNTTNVTNYAKQLQKDKSNKKDNTDKTKEKKNSYIGFTILHLKHMYHFQENGYLHLNICDKKNEDADFSKHFKKEDYTSILNQKAMMENVSTENISYNEKISFLFKVLFSHSLNIFSPKIFFHYQFKPLEDSISTEVKQQSNHSELKNMMEWFQKSLTTTDGNPKKNLEECLKTFYQNYSKSVYDDIACELFDESIEEMEEGKCKRIDKDEIYETHIQKIVDSCKENEIIDLTTPRNFQTKRMNSQFSKCMDSFNGKESERSQKKQNKTIEKIKEWKKEGNEEKVIDNESETNLKNIIMYLHKKNMSNEKQIKHLKKIALKYALGVNEYFEYSELAKQKKSYQIYEENKKLKKILRESNLFFIETLLSSHMEIQRLKHSNKTITILYNKEKTNHTKEKEKNDIMEYNQEQSMNRNEANEYVSFGKEKGNDSHRQRDSSCFITQEDASENNFKSKFYRIHHRNEANKNERMIHKESKMEVPHPFIDSKKKHSNFCESSSKKGSIGKRQEETYEEITRHPIYKSVDTPKTHRLLEKSFEYNHEKMSRRTSSLSFHLGRDPLKKETVHRKKEENSYNNYVYGRNGAMIGDSNNHMLLGSSRDIQSNQTERHPPQINHYSNEVSGMKSHSKNPRREERNRHNDESREPKNNTKYIQKEDQQTNNIQCADERNHPYTKKNFVSHPNKNIKQITNNAPTYSQLKGEHMVEGSTNFLTKTQNKLITPGSNQGSSSNNSFHKIKETTKNITLKTKSLGNLLDSNATNSKEKQKNEYTQRSFEYKNPSNDYYNEEEEHNTFSIRTLIRNETKNKNTNISTPNNSQESYDNKMKLPGKKTKNNNDTSDILRKEYFEGKEKRNIEYYDHNEPMSKYNIHPMGKNVKTQNNAQTKQEDGINKNQKNINSKDHIINYHKNEQKDEPTKYQNMNTVNYKRKYIENIISSYDDSSAIIKNHDRKKEEIKKAEEQTEVNEKRNSTIVKKKLYLEKDHSYYNDAQKELLSIKKLHNSNHRIIENTNKNNATQNTNIVDIINNRLNKSFKTLDKIKKQIDDNLVS